ncbi:MAG: hypothetical protein AB7K67_01630 [Hyphomicrobiaceae bacterium]
MFRIFFLLFVLVTAGPASSHDWYPIECCHGMDCAPVDQVTLMPDKAMRVTSKIGTTVIPASFPRRDSPDNKMHVCMHVIGGVLTPICLFLPPST